VVIFPTPSVSTHQALGPVMQLSLSWEIRCKETSASERRLIFGYLNVSLPRPSFLLSITIKPLK
jgi:hypothetical protein